MVMEKFMEFIPKIPEGQRYWFIQTKNEEYHHIFVKEGFIGIGWNQIEIK